MHSASLSRRQFIQVAATSSMSAALVSPLHAQDAVLARTQLAGQVKSTDDNAALSNVHAELFDTYEVERLNKILTTELAEFSDFAISYPPAQVGVNLYRITYPSVVPEKNNRPTMASGLIAVPEDATGVLPVVMYQHGSVFGKEDVPSFPENSTETRLMIANFAGQGYLVVAADYFGKGRSPEPNSYIVKPSTQQACFDMLSAAQAVSVDLGIEFGPLFLSGWSQGGWSALVFLNRLESVGIPVTAAAIASGPPDLYAMVNRWANNWQAVDAVYIPPLIAIMLHAFEAYYGLPGFTTTAIKPEYQQVAQELYTNARTFEEVEAEFPARLPDMLQAEFMAAVATGDDRFSQLLQASHGYRWRMKTPMRVYHGGIDEVTPAYIGQLPVGYQQAIGGAEVTPVDAGDSADHRGVFLYAIANQKQWFDACGASGAPASK